MADAAAAAAGAPAHPGVHVCLQRPAEAVDGEPWALGLAYEVGVDRPSICIYIYIYIYIYMLCIQIYISCIMCVYIYIYIYTHTYIHIMYPIGGRGPAGHPGRAGWRPRGGVQRGGGQAAPAPRRQVPAERRRHRVRQRPHRPRRHAAESEGRGLRAHARRAHRPPRGLSGRAARCP